MIKHNYLLILLALVLSFPTKGQNTKNIGIGTSTPDPSAILDITSTDKGVLVPRLTAAQVAAINTPADGLMVYLIDSACYFYYNNFQWVSLCHPGTASNGATIAIVNGRTDVQLGSTLIHNTDIPLAGKKLTFSTVGTGGNIGVGTSNPDPSAILDLTNSNNTGILIPKVALTKTTLQPPVNNPAIGLMVFNTNTQNDVTPGYYFWDGTVWMRLFSSNLPVVSTVSVTAPIINSGTAQDPNIGITTSDLTGKGSVVVSNGTNVLAGATPADIDVVGTNGGLFYGTGSSSAFTPAGTAGQYLQSNGAAAPTWVNGSNVFGSPTVNVTNGNGQLVGGTNMNIDVNGPAGTLLYGTGASSAFTAQGTTGQVLQSNGTGAPSWVNPNAALVSSDLLGSPVVSVTNGTGRVVGAGNANIDVFGTNGGVMYGTGASSAFTAAGTAGQVLRSTGAGAPVWATPNALLATNDVVGGSVVNITNGTSQIVGGVNMTVDVAGTGGGVLYGTGASSGFTAAGTTGQILKSNGTGAPAWVNPNTTLTTTNMVGAGPVVVTNGTAQAVGIGNPTINVAGTAGAVLYGTGASSNFTGAGTAGQLLQSNGAGAPTWVNPPVSLAASNGLHVSAAPDVQLGGSLTSNTAITQGGFSLSASGGAINLNDASNNNVNIATSSSTGLVNIANGPSAGTVEIGRSNTITATGSKVGINQLAPAQALDVNGNLQFSNALMPAGNAGTSGQFLKSNGAGTAPTWTNTSSKFKVPFTLGYTPTSTTNYFGLNTQAIGPFFTTTPASANQYVVISDATYIAPATSTITRVYGWVWQQSWLAASAVTYYVYYYANPTSGNTYTTLIPGTLLNPGGTFVNMTNASLGVYSFSIPLSTTLNAGDIIVVYVQFNSVPILGSTTFRCSGFVEIAE